MQLTLPRLRNHGVFEQTFRGKEELQPVELVVDRSYFQQ